MLEQWTLVNCLSLLSIIGDRPSLCKQIYAALNRIVLLLFSGKFSLFWQNRHQNLYSSIISIFTYFHIFYL